MMIVTEGSLRVDESCRVLDEMDAPIPGLYAAGSVGQGGMVLAGHGFHILWGIIAGRIAGARSADAAERRC